MTRDPHRRRSAVALLLVLASACSRGDRPGVAAPPAEEIVSENNRGVGLMGQFDYEGARAVFAKLSAASRPRR